MALSNESRARRFVLVRNVDVSGNSGTGVVAEGVEFSNGQVAMHWLGQLEAVNVYGNMRVVTALHGHEGRTVVEWLDV